MRTGSISKLRCAHFSYSFQLVLYAKHGLDVHNPVSAQGHFHQAAYILAAPVIYQPGSAFVCADTAGIFQPGSLPLPFFAWTPGRSVPSGYLRSHCLPPLHRPAAPSNPAGGKNPGLLPPPARCRWWTGQLRFWQGSPRQTEPGVPQLSARGLQYPQCEICARWNRPGFCCDIPPHRQRASAKRPPGAISSPSAGFPQKGTPAGQAAGQPPEKTWSLSSKAPAWPYSLLTRLCSYSPLLNCRGAEGNRRSTPDEPSCEW